MDVTSARPPIGGKMKARAPPPPSVPQPAPRKIFRNAVPDGGLPDTKENQAVTPVALHITLPNGFQSSVSVDGRRALMDLLVDLCAQYHLNPADHTLELATPEGQLVRFKPNAILGSLPASRAVIKEKVPEERQPRRPAPKVPEKTVRLVVNYHRGQKAVVRVSPFLPLQSLVPTICQKCDFDPARVLLLRDAVSQHELDLNRNLTELNIREIYILDQTLVLQPRMVSAPVLNCSAESLRSDAPSSGAPDRKGILGLLRFSRGRSKTDESSSDELDQPDLSLTPPTHTPPHGLNMGTGVCVEARPNTLGQSQSAMNLSRISPKAEPKKRRAPAPPCSTAPTPVPTHTPPSPVLTSQTKAPSPTLDIQLKKKKAPAPPPTTTPRTPPSVPVTTTVQVIRAPVPSDDSMSDLSHSVEDSEPNGSICSSSSSDASAESSSLAEEATPQPVPQLEPELKPEPEPVIMRVKTLNVGPEPVPELNPQPVPQNAVRHETEEARSAPELKTDEMENNRHSTVVWLQRVGQGAEQEAETVSMCSSESFADQGYGASEGLAESPSVSPEDTVSLCPDPSPSPSRAHEDSDLDEGCATWGSRHSSGNEQGRSQSVRRRDSDVDSDISAQIHLTLADLDADLEDAVDRTDEACVGVVDEVPVSVVDLDVPVTAIDEVLDEVGPRMSAYEAALSLSNTTKREKKKTPDLQNTNNNARVTVRAGSGSRSAPAQEGCRSEQAVKVAPVAMVPPPGPKPYQSKITQIPGSRFGVKTFTIVPPKVPVSQTQNAAGSLSTGAIKIDELGNLVQPKEDRPDPSPCDPDSPLLDRAKAFWSSAQKQDPPTARPPPIRTRDADAPPTPTPPTVQEPPKQANGPTPYLASAVMKKLAVSSGSETMFFSEHRKNFRTPTRRTSSQYVASAITKRSGSTTTTTRMDGPPGPPEKPLVSNRNHYAGPQRSQSYPGHVVEKPEASKDPPFTAHTLPRPAPPKEPPATSVSQTPRPPVPKKPEPVAPVPAPELNPFGPVRKFKPVIQRTVEKESSLHSSLMEAIQSGEGIERLRKVSDSSRTDSVKKPSYVEPENERSALLSAIRAHSSSARLKKTRSEPAAELEVLRKSEEDRAALNRTSSPTAPPTAPPPPPPAPPPAKAKAVTLSKPAVVLPAGGNPEAAREALLEAIRSGSGAKQLKKVPVTAKTFKVNRRLGIVRTSGPPPTGP